MPHITGDESSLFIPLAERERVLDELVRLRKKYWRIMGLTGTMANQFRRSGEFSEWNIASKNARSARYVIATIRMERRSRAPMETKQIAVAADARVSPFIVPLSGI
jgi:hypothetical protein